MPCDDGLPPSSDAPATEDGLSSQGGVRAIFVALEDSVTAKTIQDGTAIFVGRNTSSRNRDFYFYVADPAKFA